MTKEQIIQNIKARISTIESYRPDEYALNQGNLFELKDLLTMIEKDEPSIPSNLDEAEFEYVQSLDEMPANQEEENMVYEAFKTGAEWMAKQGVCIPAHIFMPCEIKDVYDSSKGEYPAAIHPDCGGSLVLERYLKDFKHNEEVIMQIRKKEE